MKTETPKVSTPIAAVDVLGVAVKSEALPSTLTRHGSLDMTKTEKIS